MRALKIYVIKPSGMCQGVRRAISLARHSLQEYNNVYCLGELIHNEWVIKQLCEEGIKFVNSLAEIEFSSDNAFLIRSHGIEPKLKEKLQDITIVDATCPIVKGIQNLCQRLKEEGYIILIFGDPQHAEVKSLRAFGGENVLVLSSLDEVQKIDSDNKIALLSQSTKEYREFEMICSKLRKKNLRNFRFYNTICHDIIKRQKEVEKKAQMVDIFIIIGGRNSSNSRNLFKIAQSYCQNTFFISEPKEVKRFNLACMQSLAIASGASTPDEFVNDTIKLIRKKREVEVIYDE